MSLVAELDKLLADLETAVDELSTSRRVLDASRAATALLDIQIRVQAFVSGRQALERAHALVGATGPAPTNESADAARAALVDEARRALARCPGCGFPLAGRREDAIVCSDRCRARLHRRNARKGEP